MLTADDLLPPYLKPPKATVPYHWNNHQSRQRFYSDPDPQIRITGLRIRIQILLFFPKK
jgi:hypothetical protein